jgi:hypothetical protein
MNAKIEKEVVGLQNCMVSAAHRVPLPSRFKSVAGPLGSQRKIIDIQTGKSVVIGLCDYQGARKALNTLFGD